MNVLAGQSIRTKVRFVILALKEASEQRVAILNLQETVAELRERDSKSKELYDNLQRAVLNDDYSSRPPAWYAPPGRSPVCITIVLPTSPLWPLSRKRTMPMKRSSVYWQRLSVNTTPR